MGRAEPWVRRFGIQLEGSVNFLRVSSEAEAFLHLYAASRVVLMPSLMSESFGLVAAGAMANGVPVLVSNRGALPETVGDAGFVLGVPSRCLR